MKLFQEQRPVFIAAVAACIVGVAIGYPVGNKTVTKTVVKTKVVNGGKLSLGLSEAKALLALDLTQGKVLNAGPQTIGGQTFQCVKYYGKLDAKKNPTDWEAIFCGKA